MAEEQNDIIWDFGKLTTYSITQEIIRGTYQHATRNDQLYIWIRKDDVNYLNRHFDKWIQINDAPCGEYRKITVNISLNMRYPMSIIYRYGSPERSELSMKELGNIATVEAGRVAKLNESEADDEIYDIDFGFTSAKSLLDAFRLGKKYLRFKRDLIDLGYVMISTTESGLITREKY